MCKKKKRTPYLSPPHQPGCQHCHTKIKIIRYSVAPDHGGKEGFGENQKTVTKIAIFQSNCTNKQIQNGNDKTTHADTVQSSTKELQSSTLNSMMKHIEIIVWDDVLIILCLQLIFSYTADCYHCEKINILLPMQVFSSYSYLSKFLESHKIIYLIFDKVAATTEQANEM